MRQLRRETRYEAHPNQSTVSMISQGCLDWQTKQCLDVGDFVGQDRIT
jgi:hypothetical protein